MAVSLSKTQIDKLGERLKADQASGSDLQLLDEYRRTFADAYDAVVRTIRDRLGLEPTGRPAKTVKSIREKLRRESVRLTQIQDIAGCRLVVPDIKQQNEIVSRLCAFFPGARVIDRRVAPSYGYRAVHVIPTIEGQHVEIQVRTSLQQRWAELSEAFFDGDPDIKYGGGDPDTRHLLLEVSDFYDLYDRFEEQHRTSLEAINSSEGDEREARTREESDFQAARLLELRKKWTAVCEASERVIERRKQ